MTSQGPITLLLDQWRAGDAAAFDQLVPAVYDHLHQVATVYVQRERSGHTLQATGLVHELFLKLLQSKDVAYADRVHFYTFSARVMRRILVDYSRRHKSIRRGSGVGYLALTADLAWTEPAPVDLVDLEAALVELAKLDEQKAQVLELRYFLGATVAETADLLAISRTTVDRAVRFGVTWLHRRLTQKASELRLLD